MNAWLGVGALAAACALIACGGDDDGDVVADAGPDATPPPDAMPAALCLLSDTECGYAPVAVTQQEISHADQLALAQRFNPAMLFTHDHIWSVSMNYLLTENLNGLEQAEHDGRLNFSYDVDETTRQTVTPQPDLLNEDWSDLPTTAGGGRRLVYFADVGGDADQNVDGDGVVGNGYDDHSWETAWIAAQGGDSDPTTANYTPVQYAHLFWLAREDRLLAISYWFYYPYDKWTNNHEGDWEHINVMLRYWGQDNAVIEAAHFSHHGVQAGVPVEELIRLEDRDGGDACLNLVPDTYCGRAAGASYPNPGIYNFNSPSTVAGGTSRVGRPIHANDIDVILLPPIDEVDFAANPELG